MTLRVGFVGLGHMGGPMCANVVAAGFPATAHDLRPERVAAAVAAGATAGASAAACAAAADVLITMLPGPREVEHVLLGAGGALAALPAGALAVDMSTSSPALGRRVAAAGAERGIGVLEAPVADASAVRAGRLNLFVGGTADDLARARPVLEAVGDPERIFHVGPHGAGYAVKLLVNLLWFVNAVAASEALVIGARAGVDLRVLHRALASGPGGSAFLSQWAVRVLEEGDYDEGFPLGLVLKDLALTTELARDTEVPAELAALVEEVHRRAHARYGDGSGEMSAMRLLEDLTDTPLRFGQEG
jgi:3-hydroxyisobutyrate dehydrogenase